MATTAQPGIDLPTEEDLAKLSPGDRLLLAEAFQEALNRGVLPDGSRASTMMGPQSDEELLDAVFELTGHRIPRNAVCLEHGHSAPSATFCDLYFERIDNCLWIGNRGGGKTANSGELHGAKCRWNPGYESAIAGAQEKQGYRAYAEFKRFTRSIASEIVSSLMSKTVWVNGSETEVLGGTVKQLNGPHPNLAQMDEVELTTWEAFEEFLNMAQGNERYAGQQLLTSTRKKAHGIVQGIVKECMEAMRNGDDSPWTLRIFCVFETMARVPNCRCADPEERAAVLAHLGLPVNELCNCHKVRKGYMDDGSPRTFEKECGGKAFKADGFVHLADVQKRFRQLSVATWNAQQRCLTPNVEGIVHKWLNERHSIPTWLPHGEFGPIYRGWDWGGNNPHAVVWCQLTTVPIGLNADGLPILTDEGEEAIRIVPEGTLVQFDEIYKTSDELPNDGGFSDLAYVVAMRELQWRNYGFTLFITRDFCDPAGFIAKREVKKKYRELLNSGEYEGMGLVVPEFKSIPAPVMESVRLHISWGEGDRILIVEAMCPKTSDEYDVYHWPDKRADQNLKEEPVKEDDHALDAIRYLLWNIERMADRAPVSQPGAKPRETEGSPARTRSSMAAPQIAPSESPIGVAPGTRQSAGRIREADTPVPGFRTQGGGGTFR